ncbi:hypothetical protein [Candidatus Absconditicoccus praedator]|uniref:hypothetical protein n=1 Tax=Candidatus Absconditicoccus praedator TaxID=2735562 RepID=UPI001E510963|nr:hypothetical protein [Candidatus Absconditicoccus praedator]UFX82636.1 hypothetical protein HLG78_00590 [Candidatus Absconditicoccus praedator]
MPNLFLRKNNFLIFDKIKKMVINSMLVVLPAFFIKRRIYAQSPDCPDGTGCKLYHYWQRGYETPKRRGLLETCRGT